MGGCAVSLVLVVLLLAVLAIIGLATGSATTAEVAKLTARPLVPEGTKQPGYSEAQLRAETSSRLAEARRLSGKPGELAAVAGEYAKAMESLNFAISQAPSIQPMLQAGIDTWRGSVDNNDRAFMLGLLGIGSELSKRSEFMDRLASIHAQMIACRLRVAEVALKNAKPESTSDTATGAFAESRNPFDDINDTLTLRNVSGQRLNNVLVITELTGADGEQFNNLFFAERWEPDQVLLAICKSDRPARETVHNVARVRFRVISDERTSRLADIVVAQPPNGR